MKSVTGAKKAIIFFLGGVIAISGPQSSAIAGNNPIIVVNDNSQSAPPSVAPGNQNAPAAPGGNNQPSVPDSLTSEGPLSAAIDEKQIKEEAQKVSTAIKAKIDVWSKNQTDIQNLKNTYKNTPLEKEIVSQLENYTKDVAGIIQPGIQQINQRVKDLLTITTGEKKGTYEERVAALAQLEDLDRNFFNSNAGKQISYIQGNIASFISGTVNVVVPIWKEAKEIAANLPAAEKQYLASMQALDAQFKALIQANSDTIPKALLDKLKAAYDGLIQATQTNARVTKIVAAAGPIQTIADPSAAVGRSAIFRADYNNTMNFFDIQFDYYESEYTYYTGLIAQVKAVYAPALAIINDVRAQADAVVQLSGDFASLKTSATGLALHPGIISTINEDSNDLSAGEVAQVAEDRRSKIESLFNQLQTIGYDPQYVTALSQQLKPLQNVFNSPEFKTQLALHQNRLANHKATVDSVRNAAAALNAIRALPQKAANLSAKFKNADAAYQSAMAAQGFTAASIKKVVTEAQSHQVAAEGIYQKILASSDPAVIKGLIASLNTISSRVSALSKLCAQYDAIPAPKKKVQVLGFGWVF